MGRTVMEMLTTAVSSFYAFAKRSRHVIQRCHAKQKGVRENLTKADTTAKAVKQTKEKKSSCSVG
jgi:hypothetical protein